MSSPASTAPPVSCDAGHQQLQRLAGLGVLANAVAVGVDVAGFLEHRRAPLRGRTAISSSAGMSRCQNADAGRMIVSPGAAVPW